MAETIYAEYPKVGTSGNDDLQTLYYDIGTESTTIYSALDGLGGNDRLDNNGKVAGVTMDGGMGDDIIYNTVNGGGASPSLVGGDGNDQIENGYATDQLKANNATIDGGAGSDTVNNYGDNASINLGAGDDSLYNVGDNATIAGGAGSDTVFHSGDYSSIDGGEGNDWLNVYSSNVTVRGGAGNDTLSGGSGSNILFDGADGNNAFQISDATNGTINAGSGNDTVYADGFDEKFLINIGAGNNSVDVQYGTDVSIQAQGGNDTINVYDGNKISIDVGDGANYINISNVNDSTASGYTINAGAGDDSINNGGDNAIINAGNGNNSIISGGQRGGNNVTITSGSGNDFINNYYSTEYARGARQENAIINAGAGNDTVTNSGNKTTIDGGDGNDEISSYDGTNISINGGAGADTIFIANGTVSGGAGDDSLSVGENVLIRYTAGDGNDAIWSFDANSTLSIGGGNYSSAVSGSDVVLTVGNGKITLEGAATLDNLNIVGTLSGGGDSTDSLNAAAASVAGMILYRTEAGYPVMAGVAFNPNVYFGDEPTNYTSKETWSITSNDGLKLNGVHYTPENSNDKWVVIVHGYGNNHKHMYAYAEQYLANGYNVLMIDQRAAGDSEGSWLTMGAAESQDLALWTQEIARQNSNAKITLFGVSMGAATAMLAASRSDVKNVTSLVEDCGYTNMMDVVYLLQANNPVLNSLLPTEMLPVLDTVASMFTGYNLSDAAPLASISGAKVPTLFIGGSDDTVVPVSMLSSLYDASGATVKEKFIVNGAPHALSASVDAVNYSNNVFRFVAEADGEGWLTTNTADNISLRGTKYNDTITNLGDNVSITTYAGNDIINNSGANVRFVYAAGDGNDVITGFDGNDTLNITGGKYSSVKSGNDLVLSVGSDKITLKDSANLSNAHIVGTLDGGSDTTPSSNVIENFTNNTIVTGTANNDTIINHGRRVTVRGLAGNDYLVNIIDSSVTAESAVANLFEGGDGNDTIFSYHSYHPTLLGGNGNDRIIVNKGHMNYINGGAGNDSILGRTTDTLDSDDWAMGGYATLLGGDGNDFIDPFYTNNSTIDGGAGNDTINMMGADSTITGGKGDDRISLGSAASVNVRINYNLGDGNDVITGFTENDTLNISGAKYSSVKSGNDLVLSVGDEKITLGGAANLADVNIIGTLTSGEDGNDIINSTNGTLVTGTAYNDTITNTGNRVTIQALTGNDLIVNSGSNVLIYGDEGNDSIFASGANTTIDGGEGSNYVNVTGSQGLYVVFSGDTTVQGFNTGFGDGSDTVYIPGTPAGVDFRSGVLTFYNDNENAALIMQGITSTAKVNLYHESRNVLNKGVFISDNDWYRVESGDLSVKSGEEVYFVGPSATNHHGVDFSGISQALNVTLDTAYIDSKDYVPGTSVWINGVYSIRGGAGNTTITGSNLSDTIVAGTGATTINARGGNDRIDLTAAQAFVNYNSGDGNDVITSFTENDTLNISGSKYFSIKSGNDMILSVGDGRLTLKGADTLETVNIIGSYDEAADLIISNSDNRVSVTGTSTNDTIVNTGRYDTIQGLAGNDSIVNSGANGLIFGDEGNDSVINSGSDVLIYGNAGNDSIFSSGTNATIFSGDGSNYVSLSGSNASFVVLEGKTTVDGFTTGFGSGSDSVYVTGDPAVDFKSGGLTFYESNGDSLTLHNVTDTAKVHLYYTEINRTRKGIFIAKNDMYTVTDSDFSLDSNEGLYFVGTSATHNHGVDFSNISRAINVTMNTDYEAEPQFWVNNVHSIIGGAGRTQITGSDEADTIIAYTGETTINASGGDDRISLTSAQARVNYESGDGNDLIYGFNANSTLNVSGIYSSVVSGNDVILTVGTGKVTLQGAADLEELNILGTVTGSAETYIGGDETIANYEGQPINFDDAFVASAFNNGNLLVQSSTGTLVIENVAGKIVDLRDGDGNVFVKAYTPSVAGGIEGRGISGFEIIEGSSLGADVIYAGDGGSSMWGGADTAADALVGGSSTDVFVGGRSYGNDIFFNASSADIVNLIDTSLSDIVATVENNGTIAIGFNTGSALVIQSTDTLSAAINLTDGTSWRFNHTTKAWQNA